MNLSREAASWASTSGLVTVSAKFVKFLDSMLKIKGSEPMKRDGESVEKFARFVCGHIRFAVAFKRL